MILYDRFEASILKLIYIKADTEYVVWLYACMLPEAIGETRGLTSSRICVQLLLTSYVCNHVGPTI